MTNFVNDKLYWGILKAVTFFTFCLFEDNLEKILKKSTFKT